MILIHCDTVDADATVAAVSVVTGVRQIVSTTTSKLIVKQGRKKKTNIIYNYIYTGIVWNLDLSATNNNINNNNNNYDTKREIKRERTNKKCLLLFVSMLFFLLLLL